jgi:hypothetical protein
MTLSPIDAEWIVTQELAASHMIVSGVIAVGKITPQNLHSSIAIQYQSVIILLTGRERLAGGKKSGPMGGVNTPRAGGSEMGVPFPMSSLIEDVAAVSAILADDAFWADAEADPAASPCLAGYDDDPWTPSPETAREDLRPWYDLDPDYCTF